jgi:radical SAM superfamily enzyme YgiQ (UPF0313 family)
MNILLVYPEFLVTFWSWKHLLRFVAKKAAFPPHGLATIARMLPKSWTTKLVDLNVGTLTDKDIKWADYVFVSAMITQKDSANEVISRAKALGKPVVLGGPIIETGLDEFDNVDHLFIGEAEETLPEFINDLAAGSPKRIYSTMRFPDISFAPIPSWRGLINPDDYASMMAQFCRGCPYGCAFCNIAKVNGKRPRLRSNECFFAELDEIYNTGFRGAVLLADDNFAANKTKTKLLLVELVSWQQEHNFPFEFTAEAAIVIADDEELMGLMVQAGFKKVFLGLETNNPETLAEFEKFQNLGRDLVADVKKIQASGLIPMSGFIVGADADNPDAFAQEMIDFIQHSGIVMAMVGVLQAPTDSKLYHRLRQEGRLVDVASGNNTDYYPNFVPRMPLENLVAGYKKIVQTIYSPKKYYERIHEFLKEYGSHKRPQKPLTMLDFLAFLRSIWWIGIFGGLKPSYYYWKSLALALFKYRKAFADVVAFQIYGVHFRSVTRQITKPQG